MRLAVKNNDGVQDDRGGKIQHYYPVSDFYDFSGNDASDVTAIENLQLFKTIRRVDYGMFRDGLKYVEASVGWSNLSSTQKSVIAKNVAKMITATIVDVNLSLQQFTFDGDLTAYVSDGDAVKVFRSTDNDAAYSVASINYNSSIDQTIITVNESISSETADGVMRFLGVDQVGIISYYKSLGMTTTEAQALFLKNKSEEQMQFNEACRRRASSDKTIQIVLKYLPKPDATNFISITRDLVFDYKEHGITGKNYGDTEKGIIDFVESTHDYVDSGLAEQGYNINSPYTTQDMIDELTKYIVYGLN